MIQEMATQGSVLTRNVCLQGMYASSQPEGWSPGGIPRSIGLFPYNSCSIWQARTVTEPPGTVRPKVPYVGDL